MRSPFTVVLAALALLGLADPSSAQYFGRNKVQYERFDFKVLATEHGCRHAYVVPNRIASQDHADEVTARLSDLVGRFLDLSLTALPPIPADPAMSEAAPLPFHRANRPQRLGDAGGNRRAPSPRC